MYWSKGCSANMRSLIYRSSVGFLAAIGLFSLQCCKSENGINTNNEGARAQLYTPTPLPRYEAKAPSTNPVPADWVRIHDDRKGYEFMVPQGTRDTQDTRNGVDVYLANVPPPYEIRVMVVAFKDKSLSKEDLIERAENILRAFGEKDIKMEPAKELSDDYSLLTFTSTGKDGKAGKGKILVATDVTDNYIMFVSGDAEKFAANEKTIDGIWGSFGMYAGNGRN